MSTKILSHKVFRFVVVALFSLPIAVLVTANEEKEAVAAVSLTVVKATAGYTHGCAVMADGTVRCWGNNLSGQIGDGTTTSRTSAGVLVSGITNAIDVGVNPGNYEPNSRSCALLSDGEIRCWGVNYASSRAYLGTGDTVSRYQTPVPVCRSGSYAAGTCVPLDNVVQMSLDGYGGCGLVSTNGASTADNRVYCWGEIGQSGTLNAIPVCTSGSVAGNNCVEFTDAVDIDSNQYHRCARTADSRAFCWGSNTSAQLGTESNSPTSRWQAAPIQENGADISDVIDISTAGKATCIIRLPVSPSTINRIQCVGETYYGILGDGVNGTNSFVATWGDICGHSRSTPVASTCATTVLPGSATKLNGGSTAMCAYIANGYGSGDNGWSCWSGSSGLTVYIARPSSSSGTVYGYIGQLCSASGTYSTAGECDPAQRFAAPEVDLTGATPCGVLAGNAYCWGMGGGGSITGQSSWVYYPSLISMGASLRFRSDISGVEPGASFAQQPEVQLVGSNGQDVATSGVAVTVTMQTLSGTGTLGGTTSVTTDAQGRATFSNLEISAVGNYVLSFEATGYGSVGQSVLVFVPTSRTLSLSTQYASSYAANASIPAVTATPSAGSGTKTFSSLTTSVCTVNASTGAITVVSTGTCTVRAQIAAAGSYGSATSATDSFSIVGATRTITISPSSYTNTYTLPVSGPTLTTTVSAGAGTITFASLTSSVCTVNSNSGVVSFVAAGTCQISATVAASGLYGSATSSTISIAVTAASVAVTTTTAPSSGTGTQGGGGGTSSGTTLPRGTATTITPSNTSVSTSTPETSTSTTTTTTVVLPKITVPNVSSTGAAALIDGEEVRAEITRVNNELNVRAGPIIARIWGVSATGEKVPLDAEGRLRMKSTDLVAVDVQGFMSGSEVEVRMYSDPVLLGRSTVSDLGRVAAQYDIPDSLEDGRHTVVLFGESMSAKELTFALELFIGDEASGPSALTVLVWLLLGAAVVSALVIPALLRRRNDEDEATTE